MSAPDIVRLYAELAEASAALTARLREGDDGEMPEFSARRDALMRRIHAAWPPAETSTGDGEGPGDARDGIAAAIRRALDADRALLAVLAERRAGIVEALRGLQDGRLALRGYRGRVEPSPTYLDRLT